LISSVPVLVPSVAPELVELALPEFGEEAGDFAGALLAGVDAVGPELELLEVLPVCALDGRPPEPAELGPVAFGSAGV